VSAGFRIDDRLGRFADLLAAAPVHAETLLAIRALVGALHPDAVESASVREGSVWWGFAPAKMKAGYAWAMPHATHVNLGFFHGVTLPDPSGLLTGTGKALRHVKLIGAHAVGGDAIRGLMLAAMTERAAALGLEWGGATE
jgi:hypothetical protein